jgi:hypothetical protein
MPRLLSGAFTGKHKLFSATFFRLRQTIKLLSGSFARQKLDSASSQSIVPPRPSLEKHRPFSTTLGKFWPVIKLPRFAQFLYRLRLFLYLAALWRSAGISQ